MKLDPNLSKIALGNQVPLLWSDERFTWGQLKSENWRARFVAFMALVDVWQLGRDEVLSLSTSLIESDDHDEVVCIATNAIGEENAGTFDDDLSLFLAEIIFSTDRSDSVRIAAYEALCKIQNPTNTYFDSTMIDQRVEAIKNRLQEINVRSLDSIDWDFVAQFKNETHGSK